MEPLAVVEVLGVDGVSKEVLVALLDVRVAELERLLRTVLLALCVVIPLGMLIDVARPVEDTVVIPLLAFDVLGVVAMLLEIIPFEVDKVVVTNELVLDGEKIVVLLDVDRLETIETVVEVRLLILEMLELGSVLLTVEKIEPVEDVVDRTLLEYRALDTFWRLEETLLMLVAKGLEEAFVDGIPRTLLVPVLDNTVKVELLKAVDPIIVEVMLMMVTVLAAEAELDVPVLLEER